jgi:flagellar basal body-associated protein FliL
MAEELQEMEGPEGEAQEGAAAAGPSRLLALLAVVVGGTLGFLVVGPMVTADSGSGEEAVVRETGEGAYEAGEAAAGAELYSIENMVVNPAGTEGILRFLMVTVAVEPRSEAARTRMESNEVVLRDALLRAFGLHTTEELLDMGQRAALLDELRGVIETVVGDGAVERIFLPQYVIQ